MSIEVEEWRWSPLWSKFEWGPRAWRWLHMMAIEYPEKPTPEDRMRAVARIQNFLTNLPCKLCRQHAKEHHAQDPPTLGSSYQLQNWVWRFHNAVNDRLKKPTVSYPEYLKLYMSEICWANWSMQCQKLSDGK